MSWNGPELMTTEESWQMESTSFACAQGVSGPQGRLFCCAKHVLAEAHLDEIEKYDLAGRLVRTLHLETPQGRSGVLTWSCSDNDGRRVAPGTYFLRFPARSNVPTCKVSVLR